jgi:hypothetical protein
MKRAIGLAVALLVALGAYSLGRSADAAVKIGSGDDSLLGGDLTDPEDKLEPIEDCGAGTEEQLKPKNATWVKMTCFPANGPGEIGHQQHPYQSWVGTPASAIFWNKPETKKWYVGFKDGGYGGPTKEKPYFCAVELKAPVILTHFTLTTAPDMPGRDPKAWAVQGSNDGKEWTDIYKCEAKDRDTTQFQEFPRSETTLFTSFTSENAARVAGDKDLKKIEAKLEGKKVKKADFAAPKAYKWYRFVAYSCFNPNTMDIADPNQPPGFSLGQMELFGVPAKGN